MERILREVRSYGFDSEAEAKEFVQKLGVEVNGEITKHSIEHKVKKAKGEIIAEQFQLTAQIDYEKIFDFLIDELDEQID